MSKPVDPDTLLLKMPSLRAVKAFVAAAKYASFTRAAEALCVPKAQCNNGVVNTNGALPQANVKVRMAI